MSNVAILGCGPSGLFAAHAVAGLLGHDVTIFSIRQKSVMPGAMYLHDPIPDLTPAEPEAMVRYIKVGSKEGYAEKVYGSPDAPCSWDGFPEGELPAWSMARAYEELWRRYEHRIIDQPINGGTADRLLRMHELVISTIPAPALCNGDHEFRSVEVHIEPTWPFTTKHDNTVVYNGIPKSRWYRASRLFGHEATESMAPVQGSQPGRKPLDTDCDCRPGIHRAGRFGRWKKGVLVHHAFKDAYELATKELP